MNNYTVVIIGAGPAGSSAAKILAKNGISVAIVDKNIFPREKLCGGLLTLRSKQVFESIFDNDWSTIVEYTSHGCKFFNESGEINKVNDYSEIYFTSRYDFDNALLDSSIKSGASAFLGSSVVQIDIERKMVILKNKNKIKYEFLIGADGVNSIVSKCLFNKSFDKEKTAFGLEVDIDRESTNNCSMNIPEIFFESVQWGYGWVFPKKGKLTVGIAGLYGKNQNLNEDFLRKFIEKRFGTVVIGKIKGHYIPFGDFKKNPGAGNILLCGDAAGLVEPITGEGIAFAMQSGKMCSDSIIRAIENKTDNAFQFYVKEYKSITKIMLWSKFMRHLIFNPLFSKIFMKLLSGSSSMPKKYLDLMEGKIEYSDLAKYMLKKIAIKPLGFIFGK